MNGNTDRALILYDAQYEIYHARGQTLQKYLLINHQFRSELIGLKICGIEHKIHILKQYKAIVPFGIKLTSELSRNKLANIIATENPETILKMDNKAEMATVNFVDEPQLDIPQIPTLVMANASENEIQAFQQHCETSSAIHGWTRFIFKPIDGASSAGLIYCEKEALTSYENMERYVLQPCIEEHHVYLVGIFAHQEQVVGLTMYFLEGGLHSTDYGRTTYHQYIPCEMINRLQNRMVQFVSTSVQHLKLNGLFQFQFLQDAKTNELYLMEVNPRICGTVSARTKNDIGPEVEKLIVPYLRALHCCIYEQEENYLLYENDMLIFRDINELVKSSTAEIGQ